MTAQEILAPSNNFRPFRSMGLAQSHALEEQGHGRGTGPAACGEFRRDLQCVDQPASVLRLSPAAARWVAAVAALLALLAWTSAASAQARVTAVDREADSVTLSFDAAVEIRQVTVEVVSAAGRTISKRPVLRDGDDHVVVAPIQSGATPDFIAWRALSRDGHVSSGLIDAPAGTASPDRPAARATAAAGRGLTVAALAFLVGLVAFRWGVAGRAWREGGLTPPGRPADDAEGFRARAFPVLEWAANRWWDALWVCVSALGIGLLATVLGTLWALDSRDIGGLLRYAHIGQASLVITALGLVTLGLGLWITRREDGDDPLPPGWQAAALGLPAAVALCVVAWAGHAATGNEPGLNIGLDALHSLASAGWLGGLVGILTLLVPAGLRLDDADRLRFVSASVVRFSALGLACVAALVLTGVYRAIAEVGAFGDLVDTAYGWILVAKIVVFAAMCAVAGYNRFVLHPHLERAGLGLDQDDAGAARRLQSTVGIELALGVVVLVLVGFLIGTGPPA